MTETLNIVQNLLEHLQVIKSTIETSTLHLKEYVEHGIVTADSEHDIRKKTKMFINKLYDAVLDTKTVVLAALDNGESGDNCGDKNATSCTRNGNELDTKIQVRLDKSHKKKGNKKHKKGNKKKSNSDKKQGKDWEEEEKVELEVDACRENNVGLDDSRLNRDNEIEDLKNIQSTSSLEKNKVSEPTTDPITNCSTDILHSVIEENHDSTEAHKPTEFEESPNQSNIDDETLKDPEAIDKGPEVIDKGAEFIDKGPEVIDKGPEVIDKGPEVIDNGPDLTNVENSEVEVETSEQNVESVVMEETEITLGDSSIRNESLEDSRIVDKDVSKPELGNEENRKVGDELEIIEDDHCGNGTGIELEDSNSKENVAPLNSELEKSVLELKDEDTTEKKPVLKVVDFRKLADPRALAMMGLSSTAKDSSIIILSSSEDEKDALDILRTELTKNGISLIRKPKSNNPTKKIIKTLHISSDSDETSKNIASKQRYTRSAKSKAVKQLLTRSNSRMKNKDILLESSLTESSSDHEIIGTRNRELPRNVKKQKDNSKKLLDIDIKTDVKLKSECYVSVLKVPTEDLKDLYLRKKSVFEIKKLLNLDHLRRGKKRKTCSTKSTSVHEDPKITKKKKSVLEKSKNTSTSSSEDVDAVDNSIIMDLVKNCEPSVSENNVDVNNSQILKDIIGQIGDTASCDNKSDVENIDKDEKNSDANKDKTTEKRMNDEDEEKDANGEKATIDKSDENEEKKRDKSDKLDETSEVLSIDESSNSGNEKKSKNSENDSSASDAEAKKRKKKWKRDELLTANISSSDSDGDFNKFLKKRSKEKRNKSLSKKNVISLDSDEDGKKSDSDSTDDDEPKRKDRKRSSSKDSSSNSDDTGSEDSTKRKQIRRKRIKRVRDSSGSEVDKTSTRKKIHRLISAESLAESTKKAAAEEKERKARILEKQKKYNKIFDISDLLSSKVDKVVLDVDEKTETPLLEVDKFLVEKLKPHQASGIQFMWDACFESLERSKKKSGSGCILAHCMGLGKTLQVIAFTHSLLSNWEKTGVKKVLVVCPLSTVLNWKAEYKMWLDGNENYEVFELASQKIKISERSFHVKQWNECGGVLLISYNMFRNIGGTAFKGSAKVKDTFQKALIDPGPDLVVCDEGHLLKNEKTATSVTMNRIKTLRRIVLTGTPLQNNLKEYFCMVQFVKPNLLGTYKEYLNRFVNPITNGQYTDSTPHDISIMRKRAHVLHKMLDGIVQRRDYSVLEPYLPPKHEYVLFLQLTGTQAQLYQHYMDRFARQSRSGSTKASFLFADFQSFQRICTHPRVLFDKSDDDLDKLLDNSDDEVGSLKDFVVDNESEKSASSDSDDSVNSQQSSVSKKQGPQRRRTTRANAGDLVEGLETSEPKATEWWRQYCDGDELDNLQHSSKLCLLFEILKECEQIGDKVLLFSQSLYSLNVIEYFLQKVDEATQNGDTEKTLGYTGSWSFGLDYYRLDGSTSCTDRSLWCKNFNNPGNSRCRLFLLSTKAGGLGINLVAANRVIVFDVSWNPSHDLQSIYRVFRFGQLKPVYVYRFVAYGTMEMKVYERQVIKQAISKRVIDEQQIDRHYNQDDLMELYQFEAYPKDRPVPLVPKDILLGEMLQNHADKIYKYHEHQTLLENKEDETLNEAEREAAWEEFENEKVMRKSRSTNVGQLSLNTIQMAFRNIIHKDNPGWNTFQINSIIPQLVEQLRMQVAVGDLTMYNRITMEVRVMQEQYAFKMREQFYRTQMLKAAFSMNDPSTAPGPSSMLSEIVELND